MKECIFGARKPCMNFSNDLMYLYNIYYYKVKENIFIMPQNWILFEKQVFAFLYDF